MGIVLARTGGRYQVDCDGARLNASLRGRMKQGKERVLVGDRVDVRVGVDGSATIEAIAPRDSLLRRRTPGRARGLRLVAANVDQVIAVGAALNPEWDSCLMDRFTAVAEANGLPVVVVINKVDLDPDAGRHAAPYVAAGYEVLLTSAQQRIGASALATRLAGTTSLFTGPTGVGKSSLLNLLVPGLTLRTAPVSRRSGAGRHTTVSAEMHPIGGGGYVVDTPGLRDIGLWGLEAREVAQAFPEFASYAAHCRFDDCRHVEEPGCAVVEAVDEGRLADSRLSSYRRFLEEAERAARHWE